MKVSNKEWLQRWGTTLRRLWSSLCELQLRRQVDLEKNLSDLNVEVIVDLIKAFLVVSWEQTLTEVFQK